jgi:hypothetical protein
MLILSNTMPSGKRKGDGIPDLRRIEYRKKEPKVFIVIWLDGPIAVNGKKFNNAKVCDGT